MSPEDELIGALNEAYRDRARVLAPLAALFPSKLAANATDPDWPVLYLSTPNGQISWHIAQADLDLLQHVTFDRETDALSIWDGHDTETRDQRLSLLVINLLRAAERSRQETAVRLDSA